MSVVSGPGVASAVFRVGDKGRVVLPVAVRRAVGIGSGDEVVARAEGDGRLVIETVESIKARVRAAAPAPTGLDTAEEVRVMRRQDAELADGAAQRRSAPVGSQANSDAVGAALIARLGL